MKPTRTETPMAVEPIQIDARESANDESFELPVYCLNCDFEGSIKVSKGCGSAQAIRWTDCPTCDTRKLARRFGRRREQEAQSNG